jgi:hypothetical protein
MRPGEGEGDEDAGGGVVGEAAVVGKVADDGDAVAEAAVVEAGTAEGAGDPLHAATVATKRASHVLPTILVV